MSRPRTHFEGDGCEPPHVITEVPAEDPDEVRARDGDAWTLSPKPTPGKRRTTERREVYE